MTQNRKAILGALVLGIGCLLGETAAAEQPASHLDQMPPQGRHHRPPPEAFEACAGKQEGDSCEVNFQDQTLSGSCISPRDDALFCLPSDMPAPPDGRGPKPPSQ